MLYVSPEQPPPCTPSRRPPVSAETCSLAMALRMRAKAFSVTSMPRAAGAPWLVGLVTVVLMQIAQQRLYALRLGFHRCGRGRATLLLPVADGGADRVFRQYRAVNLHGRQRELFDDLGVLDGQRLVDGLALHPLSGERRRSNGRSTTEGLELGVFDDSGLAVHL